MAKITGGFVDCSLTELQDVPVGLETDHAHIINEINSIGQIIVTSKYGATYQNGELMVPAVRLRHREFLHETPLWQGTSSDLRKFYNQHTITAPTATLIAPDKILTAYHAIVPSAIEAGNAYFMFDRRHHGSRAAPQTGQTRIKVPSKHTVKITCICERFGDGGPESGNDWVILLLEREILASEATPIPLGAGLSSLLEPSSLFILSHPLGLPLKHAAAMKSTENKSGAHQILSDIGSGSSGAPLLCIRDSVVTVAGVVNGGPLGFDARHLVRTPTGLTIDPGIGDVRPQTVTSVEMIEPVECSSPNPHTPAPQPRRTPTVGTTTSPYEIKFQDTSEAVLCGYASSLTVALVQTDIATFDLGDGPEYIEEIIIYRPNDYSGTFELKLEKDPATASYEVSNPERIVLAGEPTHAARASDPVLSGDSWKLTFNWPACTASTSTTLFTFGTGGPPSKLKVVVKKQGFTCP